MPHRHFFLRFFLFFAIIWVEKRGLVKMNILFTLLIQKPIDFTRQDLSKDGSYEKVDVERLYLLEENKKTGMLFIF